MLCAHVCVCEHRYTYECTHMSVCTCARVCVFVLINNKNQLFAKISTITKSKFTK